MRRTVRSWSRSSKVSEQCSIISTVATVCNQHCGCSVVSTPASSAAPPVSVAPATPGMDCVHMDGNMAAISLNIGIECTRLLLVCSCSVYCGPTASSHGRCGVFTCREVRTAIYSDSGPSQILQVTLECDDSTPATLTTGVVAETQQNCAGNLEMCSDIK